MKFLVEMDMNLVQNQKCIQNHDVQITDFQMMQVLKDYLKLSSLEDYEILSVVTNCFQTPHATKQHLCYGTFRYKKSLQSGLKQVRSSDQPGIYDALIIITPCLIVTMKSVILRNRLLVASIL